MTHKIEQIRSLSRFMKDIEEPMSYDEILNCWMRETGVLIQDPETIDYYLQLIPRIERRFAHVSVI